MRQNHDEMPTHEIIIMGNKMFYFKCGVYTLLSFCTISKILRAQVLPHLTIKLRDSPSFWGFSKKFSSTFIYQPFFVNIYENAFFH